MCEHAPMLLFSIIVAFRTHATSCDMTKTAFCSPVDQVTITHKHN